MQINLLLLILSILTLIQAVQQHKPGYCNQLNTCGKKSIFGKPLPCSTFEPAIIPKSESQKRLQELCGGETFNYVCCSDEQIDILESNLKRVDAIISSCPACHQNFYNFFCKFSCSPNQSQFVEILKTETAKDTGLEVITEINQYVDKQMASEFYDSCKNVKFSATNGFAMDLIGGGAKNYSQFLKFLGDEKPLLGGSPYQINFKYETLNSDILLRNDPMYSCNDEKYNCACTDCESSCPRLPKIRNLKKKCEIGGIPCFSFTILIMWICFIIIIGGYHIHMARNYKSRHNSVITGDDEDDIDTMISPLNYVTVKKSIKKNAQFLNDKLGVAFSKLGKFCSTFPGFTIGITLITSLLISYFGLLKLNIETNPINLWVSPNEPAYRNQVYFEENFGKWFRIEQIIISSKNESQPVLSWDTLKWWFSKEAELENVSSNVQLSDICFKPLGDTCAIQSFTQYFNGDINQLSEYNWQTKLQKCVDSPVECLPSFQQPLKSNILFDNDNILKAKAFIVTLLIDNKNDSSVVDYEKSFQKWITSVKDNNLNLHVSYSTEMSLEEELNDSSNTDIKTIVISYIVMFIYSSFALGRRLPTKIASLTKTRFLLGLSGIFIILLSVTTSVGFFSLIGLKSTLIIAEVIPFLLLAIGIDNIYLIVHELDHITDVAAETETIQDRIGKALGKIGPSCFVSSLLQFSMFLLATVVDMPAVRNFAFYSAGAILINLILQMTSFIGFLALDQQRLEDNRLDFFPWIQLGSIKLPEEQVEVNNEGESFSHKFATFIVKYKRRVLTLFILWLGVSLSLLPGIKYGLDQKIALPKDSYLIDYFDSIYKYLNGGPPIFFVIKDFDLLTRSNQQKLCGKFSGCEKYSVSNILEQEFKRSKKSMINEPSSNWLDDFFTWLNPDLDQCCRVKKNPSFEYEFCKPNLPERQCQSCYFDRRYDSSMSDFPVNEEFMTYFNQWIQEPSDPCPLGGKAPYSTSIARNSNSSNITASYFRTSHVPLRSQDDFINGYKNSLRIVEEIKKYNPELDTHHQEDKIFVWSPYYIFFVQYLHILKLTMTLLSIGLMIILGCTYVIFGSLKVSLSMTITILSILINVGGLMSIWDISLNALSLVNLLIIIGLSVEFTIHISKRYSNNNEENSRTDEYDNINDEEYYSSLVLSNRKEARVIKTMTELSGSILTGIIITKLVGISILAFTSSQIFEIYYFRMYFSLITIGAVHALVLLPILLSL